MKFLFSDYENIIFLFLIHESYSPFVHWFFDYDFV